MVGLCLIGMSNPLVMLLKTNTCRVLHELGGLLTTAEVGFIDSEVSAVALASIITNLSSGKITGKAAKEILFMVFHGDKRDVTEIIRAEGLEIQQLDPGEYLKIAISLVVEHPDMAKKVRGGEKGKLQWFVGLMLRQSKGKMDAGKATHALKQALELVK